MLALEFARLPSAAHACRVCKRATSSQSLPDHIGFDFNKRWDDVTATSVMEGGDVDVVEEGGYEIFGNNVVDLLARQDSYRFVLPWI
jgi:hypothetical protein